MFSPSIRPTISHIGQIFSLPNTGKFLLCTAKTQKQFFSTENSLEKKAIDLIFGKKSYQSFSPDEKKLVNWYQDMILKEDGGVILPNTQVDWEQRQVELLSLNSRKFIKE